MLRAPVPAMPGPPFFGEPDGQSLAPDHRRLLACVTISTILLAVVILTTDLSLRLDFSRLMPAVLDVTLREKSRPEPVPVPDVVEPTATSAVEEERPAALPPAAALPRPAETPTGTATPAAGDQPVDWYAALERASAQTVDQRSTVDSLHPEFDELRRIAAERYGPADSGEPTPAWESVEKDIYGRTLLRMGNCFQVLDDPNVGNRYAFETFERSMVQCTFSFGRKRGRNLPWVETIRAKYNHLRDPDGSRSVPGAAAIAPGN